MVDQPLPDEITAFLLTHIDSIAQLEALLLLRASPRLEWSAETVAKRLYIPPRQRPLCWAACIRMGFWSS